MRVGINQWTALCEAASAYPGSVPAAHLAEVVRRKLGTAHAAEAIIGLTDRGLLVSVCGCPLTKESIHHRVIITEAGLDAQANVAARRDAQLYG